MFGHPAFGYMIALDRLEERRTTGSKGTETRPGKALSVRFGGYRVTFSREGH
jgi:hypothetical protein